MTNTGTTTSMVDAPPYEPAPGRWARALAVEFWCCPDEPDADWNGWWLVEIVERAEGLWFCRHGLSGCDVLVSAEQLDVEGLSPKLRAIILMFG